MCFCASAIQCTGSRGNQSDRKEDVDCTRVEGGRCDSTLIFCDSNYVTTRTLAIRSLPGPHPLPASASYKGFLRIANPLPGFALLRVFDIMAFILVFKPSTLLRPGSDPGAMNHIPRRLRFESANGTFEGVLETARNRLQYLSQDSFPFSLTHCLMAS